MLTCSLVSRASVTCLLGMEQGVDVFFGVKGVGDVLAGVEQGAHGGVYGDGAVVGFFRGFSAFFTLFRVVPELSASFRSFRVSARGLLHNFMLRVC